MAPSAVPDALEYRKASFPLWKSNHNSSVCLARSLDIRYALGCLITHDSPICKVLHPSLLSSSVVGPHCSKHTQSASFAWTDKRSHKVHGCEPINKKSVTEPQVNEVISWCFGDVRKHKVDRNLVTS
jgi:hypothetical protein